jgi:aspartate aminotransferase
MQLAERMSRIGVESAFEVLVRARALEKQGKNIIHLEIGEPDFPTPANVVEAGKRALTEGFTKYGPSQGLPDLREAIAAYISNTRNIKVGPENVCVVPGGKPIMYYTMIALLEPGDEVIFPNPSFPIYESMIRFLRAVPVSIPLEESRGFAFDVELLRSKLTPKTKMIILNSPANPTGGISPREDVAEMAEILRDRDVMVLSDEIYSRILYSGEHVSIASFLGMLEKTVILDGFSKTYSMTGWRLGYGVMPTWLADAAVKLMVNSNSCTATFTQKAGLEALTGPQEAVDAMVKEFRIRRDAICKGLNEIPGFHCEVPEGAFYAFPSVKGTGIPSKQLADMLLNDAGVACLDGAAFGEFGQGFIRFSYADKLDNLMEAIRRIKSISDRWAK